MRKGVRVIMFTKVRLPLHIILKLLTGEKFRKMCELVSILMVMCEGPTVS